MSDTLQEREDQMDQHQVTKSGTCAIPGCPCRGWSAQEGAMKELDNNYQRERFPVGARVEAVIPISRSRLGADVPVSTRGKVTSHCDDGRAWVFFDDYDEGHTFHEIERFVRVVCTHQTDDERCPANATPQVRDEWRGQGQFVSGCTETLSRMFAVYGSDNRFIAAFSDKGERDQVVTEHNQHHSLVAERERLIVAAKAVVERLADLPRYLEKNDAQTLATMTAECLADLAVAIPAEQRSTPQ